MDANKSHRRITTNSPQPFEKMSNLIGNQRNKLKL